MESDRFAGRRPRPAGFPTRSTSVMILKGILLDKDGTLIDFNATWGPAAYRAMVVLARGDRAKLEALMRVSQFIEDERRFLPTSPLVAGSSAHYGPLWAEALGRPATARWTTCSGFSASKPCHRSAIPPPWSRT